MNGITTELTPKEFVRGLMRGSRPSHKRGYSAANAVEAVVEHRQLDESQRLVLLAHAEGFRDGMNSLVRPDVEGLPGRDPGRTGAQAEAYEYGYIAGRDENVMDINPTYES
jgi:hypothetical protein